VPLFVEMVMLIRIAKAVCLMVFFAIHALEDISTRLALFGSHFICFLVFHTTSCFLSVVFGNICSIAFGISRDVRTTTQC